MGIPDGRRQLEYSAAGRPASAELMLDSHRQCDQLELTFSNAPRSFVTQLPCLSAGRMQRQPLVRRSNQTSGPFGGPTPCRAARLWVRVTAAAERTAQQARQPLLLASTHSQPASTPVCNNVVGTGYSRPGSRAARGRKVGTRLRVAVDVDEGAAFRTPF